MKKTLHAILFLFTVLLCGCTQEEDLTRAAQPLPSVTVTIGGFSSHNGVETRASDVDYTTTFTKGDQIGISAITDDGVLLDDNIPYTYDGTKWAPADVSNTIHNYNYGGVTYFAYYPYSSTTMKGLKSEKEIIDAFSPASDQHTYAGYTASDLMTGAGTITDANTDAPKMTLALKHQMCLIVVEVKSKRYITTGGYEYTEPVVFNSIKIGSQEVYTTPLAYHSSAGVYKYLIKPDPNPCSVEISYNAGQINKEYTYSTTVKPSTAGKYYLVKMYNGSPTTQRDLQVGDFYYQDGSILPKDSAFYQFTENPCIGVVFKVGVGDGDNVSNYDGKLSAIHGYVLALNRTSTTWGSKSQEGTGGPRVYRGYEYTKKLLAAAATGKSFPACNYCVTYTPVPTGISSGWYFPSGKQVADYAMSSTTTVVLDAALAKASAPGIDSKNFTSTESTVNEAIGVEKNYGNYKIYNKSNSYPTRAILTF